MRGNFLKTIVTGASGMIGSNLILKLVNEGAEVYAVVRPGSKKLANVPRSKSVHIVECDLKDIATLPYKIPVTCDWFFHFAWQGVFGEDRNNRSLQRQNVDDTISAIRAAKVLGCTRFVGAGSQAEYGLSNQKLTPYTLTNPVTEYGRAKLVAFNEGLSFARDLGIDFLWGRVLSAYGIGDNAYTMVSSLIEKLLKGETCDLSSGDQTWDYIYSTDVANAFYLIAKNGIVGKPYPIGSGEARPLKEYILDIYRIVGNHSAVLNFGAVPQGALTYLSADISELNRDTGFVPAVKFVEGIAQTVKWIGEGYGKN